MKSFATRYTAAWCSQDPASVAAFFAENGSLTINDSAPSVGRTAITEAARGFMTDFPDLIVEMDGLERKGSGYIYRWTLIAASLGHFDAADYNRQLGKAGG
jgi:uncharacterized protein (TIGR02246 family)